MTALGGVWRYRGLVGNLASRELKLRHRKSLLGWLWSLINPASSLAIYTLVFGYFLKIQPPVAGNGKLKSFALFLFAGLVMWNLFSGVVNNSMAWLLGAGPLLRKIYFPPEAPLVAGTLSILVQTGIELAILMAILAVAGNAGPTFLLLPFVVVLLVSFALGIGLAVSMLNVYYRDVSHLVGIGLNLLFYATPIIYPLEIVPPRARAILRLNPLTQFVGTSRDLTYGLRGPGLVRLGLLTLISLGTLVAGWAVFRRKAPDLSEEL